MRVRRISAVAVVSALALTAVGSGANAAPKPKPKPAKMVCNLLTDPAGDASVLPGTPSDDSMDIISADVATNAKNLTVALRLKGWSDTDTNSPLGRYWYVLFNTPDDTNQVFLSYAKDLGGDGYSWGELVSGPGQSTFTTDGTATGAVDTAKGVISITVPLGDLAAKTRIKPGTKITALAAQTTALIGAPHNPSGVSGGELITVDDATGGKTYIAGTPSCLKPTP